MKLELYLCAGNCRSCGSTKILTEKKKVGAISKCLIALFEAPGLCSFFFQCDSHIIFLNALQYIECINFLVSLIAYISMNFPEGIKNWWIKQYGADDQMFSVINYLEIRLGFFSVVGE